jgi:hypothetical protein
MEALPSLLAKTKPKPSKNATATQAKKEAFAEDVSANVQSAALLFCLVG